MRLNGLDKLLARLHLKIRPGQLEKLVACAGLPRAVQNSVDHSAIKYLKCVRKRSPSIEIFLKSLKGYFKTLDDSHDLLDLLTRFNQAFPDLKKLEEEPNMMVSRSTASEDQKAAFTRILVRMSSELSNDNLDIIVALCPIPEGRKYSLTSGVKLFTELECYGCITAENTDLLNDLFRVLKLAKLTELLEEYREMYPASPAPVQLEQYSSFGSRELPRPLGQNPGAYGSRTFCQPHPLPGTQQYVSKLPQHPVSPAQAYSYSSTTYSPTQPQPSITYNPTQPQPSITYSPTQSQPQPSITYSPTQSQPQPSISYSTAHEEESAPLRPTNPTQRVGRPMDDRRSKTHTPMTNDQRPFPATYNTSPQHSINGSYFKTPKEPVRSIHPPPVNEVKPSAPPLSHVQAHGDNSTGDSRYTATSSRELFLQPEQLNSGQGRPIANNTTDSNEYTAANSGDLFQQPQQVNSGPINTGSTYAAANSGELFQPPISVNGASFTPSAAAKGTLSAGKFPSKELKKKPTNDRFKTAASTVVQTATTASTNMQTASERNTTESLESYKHESNFLSGKERQHTGDVAKVVVGMKANPANPWMAIPNAARTAAVPRNETSSSTVSMMAIMNHQRNAPPNRASPVLSNRQLNGEVDLYSINCPAEPLDQAQQSLDDKYGLTSNPEIPPFRHDESASPIGEETNCRRRKRTREDPPEEMVGPTKRHQPTREVKKSLLGSLTSSVKSLFGFKN